MLTCHCFSRHTLTLTHSHTHSHSHTLSLPPPHLCSAVYLLRELSGVFPARIEHLLPVLAEVTTLRQFRHHRNLLENIWKQVSDGG